jgi:alkylhydroperoxidase/carboxymuconolactone decarboxylase family protein YurZ
MAGKIPSVYSRMKAEHPGVLEAYEALGAACASAGPLDPKIVAIVKLATSLGAGLEGAAHSHTRKALEAGWTPDELLHAALLGTPTLGFPSMMRNRGWVLDVVGERRGRSRARK